MDRKRLKDIIGQVRSGRMTEAQAVEQLRHLPYWDLGFARIDSHRALRRGVPEVIFCQGKTPEQAAEIFRHLARHGLAMATRADEEHFRAIKRVYPRAIYYRQARMATNALPKMKVKDRYVAVVTAGSTDIPVAEEAAITVEMLGGRVERLWDVGVAGIHRLFDKLKILQGASVAIVAAGMEGALPSVVGGLVACPVIALPTSIGYGASFGGLAALLAMLNSCSPGVAVVNIDNGFGAGYLASLIIGARKR